MVGMSSVYRRSGWEISAVQLIGILSISCAIGNFVFSQVKAECADEM